MNYQAKPEEFRTLYKFLFFLNELESILGSDEMGLRDYYDHIDWDSHKNCLSYWYELKPEWSKGRQYSPVLISIYIGESGPYDNYPLWIELNDKDLWPKLKEIFPEGAIDEEEEMVGLNIPFGTDVKDVEIKHWVVDFGEKIKKLRFFSKRDSKIDKK